MLQLHQLITQADETASVHWKYYNPLVIMKQQLQQEGKKMRESIITRNPSDSIQFEQKEEK